MFRTLARTVRASGFAGIRLNASALSSAILSLRIVQGIGW
jgi:hypothetical protein